MLGFIERGRLKYKSRYKYVHNARRYRVLSASRRASLTVWVTAGARRLKRQS